MERNPIQVALEEIEQEAAAQTAALLLQQDDYLRAIELVESLKKQSPEALADLNISLCFYSGKEGYGFNVYADRLDPIPLCEALSDHVAQLSIRPHGETWDSWKLADYPGLQFLMPRGIAHPLPLAA